MQGDDEKDRLEQRLTKVMRENSKLRAAFEDKAAAGAVLDGDDDTAVLRERIGELAAEVVHLTAMLEGEQSPIFKLLEGAAAGGTEGQPSLADRIRALRDAEAEKAG